MQVAVISNVKENEVFDDFGSDLVNAVSMQRSSADSMERGLRPRASIDSSSSSRIFLEGSGDRMPLMPIFLQQFLRWSGGRTGGEPVLVKALMILSAFVFALAPASASWFYGMPLPEAIILYFAILIVVLGSIIVRWQILRSGLIWSLLDSEIHKQTLKQFEAEIRALWVSLPVEGIILSGIAVVFGMILDVGGRVASHGESCRIIGLVYMLFNAFQHCFVAASTKFLPLVIRAVCNALAEDLQCFHKGVEETALAASTDSASGTTNFLQDLQQHELVLRTRFAAANKTIEPALRFTIGSLSFVAFLALILIVRAHRQGQHAIVVALWAFISLQYAGLLVSVLHSVARVGDRWNQIVDDLNTPLICSRTASVLSGVPVAQRLAELRYMGIVLNGHTINSSTVSSLLFTLGSGLFLTLWTVMTS